MRNSVRISRVLSLQMLVTAALVLALTGLAYAKGPELNSPILQVDSMGDDVVCFAVNVGYKNVTIVMEIYAEGELRISSGERVLEPNEIFSIGTGGAFRWQLKIIVVKGDKSNVRGIMYGFLPNNNTYAVEAR